MLRSLLLFAILVSALAVPVAGQEPAKVPSSDTPSAAMLQKPWEGRYKAMVHVRYHLNRAASYTWWNTVALISTFVLSIISLVGPFMFVFKDKRIAMAWGAFGLLAFLVAGVLNYAQWGESAGTHTTLARQWNSIELDWTRLNDRKDKLDREQLENGVFELAVKEKAIEDNEPVGYNEKLLAKCQQDVNVQLDIKLDHQ